MQWLQKNIFENALKWLVDKKILQILDHAGLFLKI